MTVPIKHYLREPLLHFLILGAALFAISGTLPKRTTGEPAKIVVSQARIEHLAAGFTGTWLRPPTAEELDGLIRDYVHEEVYYREATAMGLDRDDAVIRRRLQQKLEFVSADIADLTQPTEEQLRVYLQDHPDKFRIGSRLTFSQVYLNRERHGESLPSDALELLWQLRQVGKNSDASLLGDPSLLESQFFDEAAVDIAKQYGEKFVTTLNGAPLGEWQGPVDSSYGVHLVLVERRTEARTPALEEVRDAVRREWNNMQRLETTRKFYDGLLKRYTVTVEQSPSIAETANKRR
ncbi:MAG: peptidylprolyl isomerase [Bradyrhizobium sp.]